LEKTDIYAPFFSSYFIIKTKSGQTNNKTHRRAANQTFRILKSANLPIIARLVRICRHIYPPAFKIYAFIIFTKTRRIIPQARRRRVCGRRVAKGRHSVSAASWAFNNTNSSAANCGQNCANNCANNTANNSDLRSAVLAAFRYLTA
jgi:hypothetical protein